MANFTAGQTPIPAEWNEMANSIIGQTSGSEPNKKLKFGSLDLSDPSNAKLFITGGTEVDLTSLAGFLLVGVLTAQHLAIDGNEIQSKASETTAADLFLNRNGGNVGIGTSSIDEALHVEGTETDLSGTVAIKVENLSVQTDDAASFKMKTSASANIWQAFARNGEFFIGIVGTADYFSIDGSGNLGIGTNSPDDLLHVFKGDATLTANVDTIAVFENSANNLIEIAGGTTSVCGVLFSDTVWRGQVSYDHNTDALTLWTAATPALTIDSAQNIQFTGTNYASAGALSTDANGNVTTASDAALKEKIQNFSRGLKEVLQLKPRSFHWTKKSKLDTKQRYYGFVAQEVEKSIPEAVDGKKGHKSISDRALIGSLVNAIKEQNKTIQDLLKRVEKLEAV